MNLTAQLENELVFIGTQNERFKRQTATKILKLLKAVDKDILDEINREGLTEFKINRLKGLIKRVRELLVVAYADSEGVILDAARQSLDTTINRVTEEHVKALVVNVVSAPSVNAAYTAALAQPFRGRLLREHWKKIPLDVARSLEEALRIGYLEGDTQNQIFARARRVLNRQKVNFTRATTNTALAHFQSFAHRRFYERNRDLYSSLKLQATLDLRTSDICKSRDGRTWPIDTAPRLPFHYNERSEYIGVLKRWQDQNYEVPERLRSSMDGLVPESPNYKQWIDRQSFSRQSEVFGRQRATLVRDTDLTIDDLFGRDRVLPLAEIKAKFPEQFASLG